MSNIKSSEIIFLYDLEKCNPNGDPIANNLPRIDEETSKVYATDVFLKHHIREYMYQNTIPKLDGNFDIWVRDTREENGGKVVDAKKRYESLNISAKDDKAKEEFLERCLDAQMFGAVVPLKKENYHLTGAWQFMNIKSLHQVDVITDKGITTFASGDNKSQGTFREDHYVNYALMQSYSRVNANAAEKNLLKQETLDAGLEAMWYGIKNLNTRSKLGHDSKLLLVVEYKTNNRFIGNKLNNSITLTLKDGVITEKGIRAGSDYNLNMDALQNLLVSNKSIIHKIKFHYEAHDPHVSSFKDFKANLQKEGIEIEDLKY